MLYLIKTGSHYPVPKQITLHSGITGLSKNILFYENCIYHLGNKDDNDINKLYGFTTDLFGQNSVRIGWNIFSAKTGVQTIKLWGYVHVNGKRIVPQASSEHLIGKFFKTGTPIECNIFILNGYAYFTAKQGSYQGENIIRIPFPKNAGTGYYQYPYFGGTSTCPHNMNIEIN